MAQMMVDNRPVPQGDNTGGRVCLPTHPTIAFVFLYFVTGSEGCLVGSPLWTRVRDRVLRELSVLCTSRGGGVSFAPFGHAGVRQWPYQRP